MYRLDKTTLSEIEIFIVDWKGKYLYIYNKNRILISWLLTKVRSYFCRWPRDIISDYHARVNYTVKPVVYVYQRITSINKSDSIINYFVRVNKVVHVSTLLNTLYMPFQKCFWLVSINLSNADWHLRQSVPQRSLMAHTAPNYQKQRAE